VSIKEGYITFRYKNHSQGGHWQTMRLQAHEFLRRFMLHVLPRGFVRIRAFGLLANGQRATKLALCRELLGAESPLEDAPSPEPELQEIDSDALPRCPHCRKGLLHLVTEVQRPRVSDLVARTYRGTDSHDTS
jgi:hypothetical protein